MGTITAAQSIVRVQNFRDVTPDEHFFVDGKGHQRRRLNDGQPDVLRAKRNSVSVSGRLTGTVRMTPIKGAPGWFSLRSIGKASVNHLTIYVKDDSLVVLDGDSYTVRDLYAL